MALALNNLQRVDIPLNKETNQPIISHSSFRKAHKSSIFWGFLFWAFSPMIFHTFSIGFISRLCGGHFITAIPFFSRKLNTVLALWQGALSCINIEVSTVPLCKWGKSMLAKKFFINTGINITVKMNNGSHSQLRNHPWHHYAPTPNFSFLERIEENSDPYFYMLQTSYQNKWNLDSSLKWTIFHCSSVHRICCVAKSKQTFWFFFEIKVFGMELEPLFFLI